MRLFLNLSLLLLLWQSTTISVAQKTLGTSSINGKSSVRKAFLIGNKEYEMGRLENTERDVDSMETALKELGFQTVSYKNKDYRSLELALEKFISELSKDKTEIVIFYFSGHGLGYGETNYLLPIDTQLTCVDELKSYEAMALNHIVERILAREIKHNYFFIDACRNLPRVVANCDGSKIEATKGLVKPLNNYTRAVISFATGAGQTADDNTYDSVNSLFTSELIKYLPTKNVTMRAMIEKVKKGVNVRSGKAQNPQKWDDVIDDYTLVPTLTGSSAQNPLVTVPFRPATTRKISVIAYKPGSRDVDFEVIQMTMKSLQEKFPDYEIGQQMSGKGLSDNAVLCTVTRKTVTKKNPVTINNETYDLVKANTQLHLKFDQGKEIKSEVELSEVGTDHDQDRAVKNSIEESLKKMKDVIIMLD